MATNDKNTGFIGFILIVIWMGDNTIGAIVFSFSGFILIIDGLYKFKTMRMFSDTPTAKIDSMPMGTNSELKARAVGDQTSPLISPFSKKKYAVIYWQFEEWSKFPRELKYSIKLCSSRFLIINDGGKENAVVDLYSGSVKEKKPISFSLNDCEDRHVRDIREFVDRNFDVAEIQRRLRSHAGLGSEFILKESGFGLGERVYVFGECVDFFNYPKELDRKFTIPLSFILDKKEVFNQLKSNKKNLKRFDVNSDKRIDKYELENILKEYIDGNHSLYTDLNIKKFKDVKICISGQLLDFGRDELEESGSNLVNYRSEKLIVNDLKSSIEARLIGGGFLLALGICLLLFY
tara:strand:- start:1151 stop:2194 length:1044 start_codon:yes stop_codon:yes gene_type:complete